MKEWSMITVGEKREVEEPGQRKNKRVEQTCRVEVKGRRAQQDRIEQSPGEMLIQATLARNVWTTSLLLSALPVPMLRQVSWEPLKHSK